MYEKNIEPDSVAIYKKVPMPFELERQRDAENGIPVEVKEKPIDSRIQQYLESYD